MINITAITGDMIIMINSKIISKADKINVLIRCPRRPEYQLKGQSLAVLVAVLLGYLKCHP